MKNKYISLLIISLIAAAASCGTQERFFDMSTEDASLHFPSAGEPSGTDALSSSTNFSGKEQDTAPKLDPLSGAVYIPAPQIGNYGTVGFSYPISIPSGRAGLQPQVGLSYSSSGGDGLAGVGWSLSTGLASISRVTSNGELWYDARDTFSFNGKRLVKVSGGSASEDGVYRCEIESDFVRLELRSSSTGGVWHLFDKAGMVTVLGETSDARIYRPDNAGKTYIWNYSRSFDLNGNFMYAVYDRSDYEDTHVAYLKEIRYTGSTGAGTTPCQYVRFSYAKRDDSYVSKSAGFIMRMDRLLDTITVGWSDPRAFSDTTLWSYTLVFKESEDSHRPLLATVESTRTTTKPEFIYQEAVHSFVWQMAANPWSGNAEIDPKKTKFFEGDFNGDGISDMVFFNPETGEWKAAEGNRSGGYLFKPYANGYKGYGDATTIQFFKGNVTGDYNGDGRSDIAFYLTQTREFIVAEHDGTVLHFRKYGTLPSYMPDIFACEWFSGDYDGNGLSDALLFYEPTGEWYQMNNLGGSFSFTVVSTHFKNLYRADFSPDSSLNSFATMDTSPFGKDRARVNFLCGDYNGDGSSDISVYDARSGKWYVGENGRASDGKFVISWKLYKIFTAPESALFAHDRFSGDFNGDGYSDFLLLDRDTGKWTLGSTENGTITFSTFSALPSGMKGSAVTRWLQGDFNGDGRTDIGFYSQSDNNFWVGEATPTGFRYRIYNNLSYGPDPAKVLDKAPLPAYDTEIATGKAVIAAGAKVYDSSYQFNGNVYKDRGERVFAGSFSGSGAPELLVYKGKTLEKGFYLQKQGETAPIAVSGTSSFNLDDANCTVLNRGKAESFGGTADSLVVCSRAAGTGAYTVHAVSSSSSTQIASIDSALSFDPAKSFYLTNSFGWGSPALLVCGDTPSLGDPAFWYFYKDKPDGIKLSIIAPETLAGEFSNIRAHRESYRIVALSNGKIVLVDMRAYPHAWYSGKIDTAHGDITFSALDGSPAFEQDSTFDAFTCKPTTNGFIYAKAGGSGVIFHTVTISGTTVSDTLCTVPNVTFTGAYDAQNRPLVTSDGKLKAVVITGTSYSLAACEAETVAFTRADLIEEIYPYTWIQGDYNGDGKTDIGIVHLKDSKWYFAETKGTVPDLISNVKNGIGGTYDFTYENSTRFDNTDENGIARLPMNYKVCTSVSVHDGYGGKIVTNYAYAGGFAYSAFIDGKKETDYFGFSEFTVTDAAGHSTVNAYNTVPYDDYRKNRALAGAIKTSTAYGTDRKEYSRTEYDYTLHEVRENNTQSPSWLIEPTKVRRFMQGTLVETREAHIELAAAGYSLESRTDSVTDHYGSGQTVTSFSEFTNDESTNEMRIAVKKNFVGSANEVRSDYTYDSRGNLSIELNRYTGSGLAAVKDRETRFAYDAFGNRTRVTRMGEGPGRIVETEYDRILNQYVVKETLVNDPELSTSYEINYDAAFGAAQKKTDPNGGSIYYDYDSCGRLSRQRIDTDSGVETLARYYYDAPATGWSARPASGKVIQYTGDGFTKETRVYVDGLGRTLHSVWNSSDSRCVKSGKVTYDASGRVIRKGQSLWADASEIDSYAETTEKNTTNTEYDASGRVSRVTLPAAYSGEAQVYTSMIYNDPWETVSVQSWGRNTRTVKNARGMVLTVEEAGRGDDGKMARSQIGFCYDLAGNRIKKQDLDDGERMTSSIDTSLFAPGKKDASGKNIAQWRYDGFGQLVETSDPDLGYSKAVYNSYGDVAQRIDSQNRTTTYTYDRQGRLTAKMLPETEGRVIYSYDTGGENALGKVTKIDDPAQTKQFDYDRIGRVRHENREIKNNGGSYDTDFTYNLLNRTKSIKYPIDPTTKERITTVYTHGASGIEGIEITQGLQTKTIVKDVTYNEFGQMTGLTRGNETRTSYTYDERGRLTNLLTRSAGTGTVIQNVTYGFKPDNSISAREDAIGADIETRRVRYDYRYDGLNRLVGAEGNLQHGTDETTAKKFKLAYGYAQNGNMLSKSVYDTTTDSVDDRWTYTYANHAVTSISSSKTGTRFLMNYDVSGNMTSQEDRLKKVLKDIDFDSSNRITKVTNPANGKIIGTYEYDDQGFRVRKLAAEMLRGAEKTVEVLYPSMYFAIEKQRNSIGVEIPNTSYAVNNIYLNGVRVAASLPNGECQYYLTDQVDSVSVVTDDKASVVNRFEYLPFGEAWASEGDGLNRPKYCSAELDAETNFYYMNARYQDPGICRFTTPDTVIDGEYSTQGWNRYSYCHNNPIIYKDPTGHLTAGEIDSMGWMGGDGGKLNDRGSPIKGVNLETLLQPAEKGGRLTSPMKRMRAVTDGRTGETVMASHPANDFSAKNTPLQSIIKGKMEYAENRGGAGNIIRVKGDNGVTVEYFHTTDDPKKKNDSKQLDGKRVKPGDPLGFSGNTGFGTGSGYHLHVQVWEHVENTLGNNIRARLQMSESGKGMYRMEEGDATPRFYHDPQKYLKDNKQRIKKEGS